MNILVIGAGAVGSVLGMALGRDHEVTVCVRPARVDACVREGIRLEGAVQAHFHPRCVSSPPPSSGDDYDMIMIATKAYDTEEAAIAAAPLVNERSIVVSVQNGMNNLDILTREFGDRAVIGVTTMGATKLQGGAVRLVSRGRTLVGSPTGRSDLAERVADALRSGGLEAEAVPDIRREVWFKAVINASINPLASLTGCPNGHLLRHPHLTELSKMCCLEAARAAGRNGIELPADLFEKVEEVIARTGENRCSMLQDLESGRRTEVDQITGSLVAAGEAKGAGMMINRALWSLVRQAEGRPLPARSA